jgi:hypothetical protein
MLTRQFLAQIVVATNIAETSITIPDVVVVVDSGRQKEQRYDAKRGMASLVEAWVSQVSPLQSRMLKPSTENACFRQQRPCLKRAA